MNYKKRITAIAPMLDWMNKLVFMRDTSNNDVNLMHQIMPFFACKFFVVGILGRKEEGVTEASLNFKQGFLIGYKL